MSELLCTVEPRNFEIPYFRHLFSSFAFPVSPFLATPYSASFSQYTHHLSSVHVHTTYISIAYRVFSSDVLLMKIVTSSTCDPHLRLLSFRHPYNSAGLTATLYTFPFTLAGTRLSQITPDILLHPFHPACTIFFTSLPR